jgi:hypothetical protein
MEGSIDLDALSAMNGLGGDLRVCGERVRVSADDARTIGAAGTCTGSPVIRAMDHSITQRERKAMATTQKQLDAVLEHIRLIPDLLPALRVPRSPRDRERLVRKATLPPELLHAAVDAVENTKSIKLVSTLRPEAAREALGVIHSFEMVARTLEELARSVRHTADTERAELGGHALQIYYVAKGFARSDPDAAFHAEVMRKILQRQRRRSARKRASALKSAAK